jgi:DNA primase
MSTPTEEIKERLPIAEVAGSYLKLEKAGRNYKARCPFHNEKTPSFFISPDRNTYFCFGCNAKGDIFTLVEHFEGVDFRGALESLAKRANVQLPQNPSFAKKDSKGEERLAQIIEDTTVHFENNLNDDTAARTYLLERGLTKETIQEWRLGYAKDAWRDLFDHLIKKGYNDHEIDQAGLIKKTDKGWYDRFRKRIMFPIANGSGNMIAFSGRLFPGIEEEGVPKYLNSPETPLFHKSHILYGLDRAKGTIRKSDFSIVVEGQMDLLMSHQSGFTNTVATSGTSLTEDHLRILKRFSLNVVLAMDADNAGIMSAARGARLALIAGMNVKVAAFTGGKDPADIAKEDPQLLKKAIRESLHIVEFLTNAIQKRGYDERKFRLTVQKEVFPYVRLIENRIDREHFIQRLANRLGLTEEAVRFEVERATVGEEMHAGSTTVPTIHTAPKSRRQSLEDRLLGMLLIEEVKNEPLIDVVWLRGILSKYRTVPTVGDREGIPEELLFETERLYGENGLLKEEAIELVQMLENEYRKDLYTETLRALKEAERLGDTEGVAKLMAELNTLSQVSKSQ